MAEGKSESPLLRTREEIARSKITDPYHEPFPLWHETNYWNLEQILTDGLISGNEAKRRESKVLRKIQIKIGRRSEFRHSYSGSYNDEHVSLADGLDPKVIGTPDVALIIDRNKTAIIDPNNVDHGIAKDSYLHPKEFEKWVEGKIPTENFIGIIIGEHLYGGSHDASSPAKVRDIINIVRRVKPKYALPIYFQGKVVWPNN